MEVNQVFGLQESCLPDFTDRSVLNQLTQRDLAWQLVSKHD